MQQELKFIITLIHGDLQVRFTKNTNTIPHWMAVKFMLSPSVRQKFSNGVVDAGVFDFQNKQTYDQYVKGYKEAGWDEA